MLGLKIIPVLKWFDNFFNLIRHWFKMYGCERDSESEGGEGERECVCVCVCE